jgi:hypothetical protein
MSFINPILIFILCFGVHFIYEIFPNFLTVIFFSVNESIWEHMKMLFTSIVVFYFFKYIFKKKENLLAPVLAAFCAIPIYLILYLPIYCLIGYNIIYTFFILLLTLYLTEFIKNEIKFKSNKLAIILLIIIYFIFGFLTFYPPKNSLFYDFKNEIYGLKKS